MRSRKLSEMCHRMADIVILLGGTEALVGDLQDDDIEEEEMIWKLRNHTMQQIDRVKDTMKSCHDKLSRMPTVKVKTEE